MQAVVRVAFFFLCVFSLKYRCFDAGHSVYFGIIRICEFTNTAGKGEPDVGYHV